MIKNKNRIFIFGQTLQGKHAQDPGDIIWEHFTSDRFKFRLRKVLLFLAIFGFFIVTMLLKLKAETMI